MEIFFKTIVVLNYKTRLKILYFININKKVCICDIENSFVVIQSRVSRHLKILKEDGFLKVERIEKWVYYSIKEPLDEFRKSILKKIGYLEISIPSLKEACKTREYDK